MRKKIFSIPRVILKYPENYVAISCIMDKATFQSIADANGGIVPIGTFVHVFLDDRLRPLDLPENYEYRAFNGITFADIDIDSAQVNAVPVLVEGYIKTDHLPVAPTSQQIALAQRFEFLD